MIKKLLYIITVLMVLTVASALFTLHTADTSGDDALMDETPPEGMFDSEDQPDTIMAFLEYENEVSAINEWTLLVRDHPGPGIDTIVGGFIATNFIAHVRLRNVVVPTACHTPDGRQRPHVEIARERERWDKGLKFTKSILMLNQSIRLSNVEVIDNKLVADAEFYLGGAWHDLAVTLSREGFARPIIEGYEWNFGAEELEPHEK